MSITRRGVNKNPMITITGSVQPASYRGSTIDHRYRTLLDVSSNVILFLSPDYNILEWNRAAEAVTGWMADEVLGRSYMEICLPAEAQEPFRSRLTQVIGGMEVRGFEGPILTRRGSETMLSWSISLVLGNHGDTVGLMAIGTDLVSYPLVGKELRSAPDRLCNETRLVEGAKEEERRRIARELHDEFGQTLTTLKFDLAWCALTLRRSPASPDGRALLDKVRTMSWSVDALMESVHATAASLRPAMLDDLGLVPALECLAQTLRDCTGACCEIDATDEFSSITLSSETSIALFRTGQELMTNVIRHAAASLVHVRLYRDGARVTLAVIDNGKGITRERMTWPQAFGLLGIQERSALLGGRFHIDGAPGRGTKAYLSLPIEEG